MTFNLLEGVFTKAYSFNAQRQFSGVGEILAFLANVERRMDIDQLLDVTLKAPNLRSVGNWSLSAHYDVLSGVTTAVLYGTNVIVCTDHQDKIDALSQRRDPIKGHPNLMMPEALRLQGSEAMKTDLVGEAGTVPAVKVV